MAEDSQDQSQKTEDPTEKRLQDSRQKGQVAVSREVNHWFIILASAISIMALAPMVMSELKALLFKFIEQPHAIPTGRDVLPSVLSDVVTGAILAIMPVMLVLILAAFGAGIVQNGFLFATEQIMPKLEKISPVAGFKRLFSVKSVVEFLKGVAKLVIVTCVGIAVLWPHFSGFERMPTMELRDSFNVMHGLVNRLMIGVLAIVSLIAALDFLFQRMQHTKQLRMSRQDIKDEMKQSEGDPHVRARLRQIRRERAQQRMMQAVPEASVVITNPTHFAVALKYEMGDMNAPVMLAKGADNVAARIREVAGEHDIPIVSNPPLARAIFAGVEIGEEIPAEHYKAVAEIIGYVLRLKRKLPGAARPPAGSTLQ
jgi:flagellar biosynthetic protein FlhB